MTILLQFESKQIMQVDIVATCILESVSSINLLVFLHRILSWKNLQMFDISMAPVWQTIEKFQVVVLTNDCCCEKVRKVWCLLWDLSVITCFLFEIRTWNNIPFCYAHFQFSIPYCLSNPSQPFQSLPRLMSSLMIFVDIAHVWKTIEIEPYWFS